MPPGTRTPQLSTTLVTFAPDDPGGWQHVRDRAQAADRAGIDRLVVSDRVAFGENLDAYGDPAWVAARAAGNPPGPTATGSNRSPC